MKYPRLTLLIMTFIVAYLFLYSKTYEPLNDFLISLGYLGIFVSGILYAYGFTAAISTSAFLILADTNNILYAGLIGGFGSLVGDLFIFRLIRDPLNHEMKKLFNGKIIKNINNHNKKLRNILISLIACFIIASPLPDEFGVSLLSAATKISTRMFSVLSYVLNTIGIFIILIIGKSLV